MFDRLNAFLPQIKQANQQLEEDLKNDNEDKYNIEAVDEDQPYIEMVRPLNCLANNLSELGNPKERG